MKYKVYYYMEGDVDVDADSEEEAREAFSELTPVYLAGQTYCVPAQIDDIKQIE